jgi:hypothetical protein
MKNIIVIQKCLYPGYFSIYRNLQTTHFPLTPPFKTAGRPDIVREIIICHGFVVAVVAVAALHTIAVVKRNGFKAPMRLCSVVE